MDWEYGVYVPHQEKNYIIIYGPSTRSYAINPKEYDEKSFVSIGEVKSMEKADYSIASLFNQLTKRLEIPPIRELLDMLPTNIKLEDLNSAVPNEKMMETYDYAVLRKSLVKYIIFSDYLATLLLELTNASSNDATNDQNDEPKKAPWDAETPAKNPTIKVRTPAKGNSGIYSTFTDYYITDTIPEPNI
jgi:hypothetical protein